MTRGNPKEKGSCVDVKTCMTCRRAAHARQSLLPAGASQGLPHVASVLFAGSEAQYKPQSLFGCLDASWRDGSGFWVHPTAADAAIHGAAVLQNEARTVSVVDYYAPSPQLQGELPPLLRRVISLSGHEPDVTQLPSMSPIYPAATAFANKLLKSLQCE